jgi:hypothetical protein
MTKSGATTTMRNAGAMAEDAGRAWWDLCFFGGDFINMLCLLLNTATQVVRQLALCWQVRTA